MPAHARKPSASEPFAVDTDLVVALNQSLVALLKTVPIQIVEQGVRKWVDPNVAATGRDLDLLLDLAGALSCVLHLFAPSLIGTRPIDRHARAAASKGGYEARALAALAASKLGLFHVESFGPRDLATARDCVTGATFELVSDSLSPILLDFDVATRLCPLGDGRFWPMGPMVPVGPHGKGRAARFPTRPGKGLINEGNVAAQLYRDYVRAGAPFGVDFGLCKSHTVVLTFVDPDLGDFVDGMRKRGDGPEPKGEMLARLRDLASLHRLASALNCAVELDFGGVRDGAAIYRAAAGIFLEVLCERARIGSKNAIEPEAMRQAVSACFGAEDVSAGVAALLDALLRERLPRALNADGGDLTRVIERIRAMRNKTVEQGCTEQEALIAADKVAELLERYGLTLSEIEMRKQTCEGFGFDLGRKQSSPIDDCFRAVAAFCDCRTWSEVDAAGMLRHVFFGLPADVEAARCVKDLVEAAFDTETEAFKRGALYLEADGSQRRATVKSFQIGLGGGVTRKLLDLKRAREAAASKSTGRDLTIVKRSIVDEELEKLGFAFHHKKTRGRRVISEAYKEGVAASHRFQVNEKIA